MSIIFHINDGKVRKKTLYLSIQLHQKHYDREWMPFEQIILNNKTHFIKLQIVLVNLY